MKKIKCKYHPSKSGKACLEQKMSVFGQFVSCDEIFENMAAGSCTINFFTARINSLSIS